jgi:hypothetical protein
MIYLIGGMPRVGKSTLAKMVLERNKISWMPLDIIRGALHSMSPDLGIKEGENWWTGHHEKFFPFIKKLVHRINESNISYTLEGDSFLPEHADYLIQKFGVGACFLGTSKLELDTLKKFKGAADQWTEDLSEEELMKLPDWIIEKSREYKAECEKHGIKYFDVSSNYSKTLEEAYEYLVK